MRWVDRVNLHGEIGDPPQGFVGAKRGDDVVRRADVDVKRADETLDVVTRRAMASVEETFHRFLQAQISEAQGFGFCFGDEHAPGADDAGSSAWRESGEIGVDDRVL